MTWEGHNGCFPVGAAGNIWHGFQIVSVYFSTQPLAITVNYVIVGEFSYVGQSQSLNLSEAVFSINENLSQRLLCKL